MRRLSFPRLARTLAANGAILCLVAASAAAQGNTEPILDDENSFSAFVGAVTPVEEGHLTSVTAGMDYEARFTESLSLATLVNAVFGGHPRKVHWMVGPVWRIREELRVTIGPGFEVVSRHREDGSRVFKGFALMSVGAAYAFNHRGTFISPLLYADFFGGTDTNITYGIAIGNGF